MGRMNCDGYVNTVCCGRRNEALETHLHKSLCTYICKTTSANQYLVPLVYYIHYSCFQNELLWAQILSVIALFISVAGWWLAWAAGLAAVIILLLDCCVNMKRVMFTVAGVCAFIAAVGEVLVATSMVDFGGRGFLGLSSNNMMIMAIVATVFWVIAGLVALKYGGKSLC